MEKIFSYSLGIRQANAQMNLRSHCVESWQRCFWILDIFLVCFAQSLCNVDFFIYLLESLVPDIKFLQFVPGEYFFTSVKISVYVGLVLIVPCFVYQIIVFISPSMTTYQQRCVAFFVFGILFLFVASILFSFFILIPVAMIFFMNYGLGLVEPLWSFDRYSEFILVTLLHIGLVFQLPMFQLIFGIFRIVSSSQMGLQWRWVFFLSSIAAGVLTPSADPITQILMLLVLISLYSLGGFFVFFIEEMRV